MPLRRHTRPLGLDVLLSSLNVCSPEVTSVRGSMLKRIFGLVLALAALGSCRDYNLQSHLTSQDGLISADRFAAYGREQAEAMTIAREFGAALQRSRTGDTASATAAAMRYARKLPDLADVKADPQGLRLTLRFKSGWRTMVNPIEDGKSGGKTNR
jgi:hypothetical protein